MQKPDAIESYSVILMECQGSFLFLKRSMDRRFAPGLWTGVGGRVEVGEFSALAASALRELKEEAGIEAESVSGFTLRRVVLVARPGDALVLLLYFTGRIQMQILPGCPEGTLAWIDPDQAMGLEIVETSRPVLPRVMQDALRDPAGIEAIQTGVAAFDSTGRFKDVVWTE